MQTTSSGAAAAQEAPGKRPAFYAQTPDGTRFSAGAFSDLHLSRPLLKACAALGYTHPTPIQVLYSFPAIAVRVAGCPWSATEDHGADVRLHACIWMFL